MKIYDYNIIRKLYVIGDVHGEFKELFNYIKVNGLSYNKESFKEELHPLEIQEQEENQDEELTKYKKRFEVRGGITGLAQINGRNAISSWEERFAFDLEYINKCSLCFDIKINT